MTLHRRRLLVILLLAVSLVGTAVAQQTEKIDVTRTGSQYHRETRRSLSTSKIEMSLAEAAARYGPCTICKPPVPSALPASPLTPTQTTAKGLHIK